MIRFLIGLERGASFLNQSQSEVQQNRSSPGLPFDTQLKVNLRENCIEQSQVTGSFKKPESHTLQTRFFVVLSEFKR